MVARVVGCVFDTYEYKEVETVVLVLFFLFDASSWTFGVSWTPALYQSPPASSRSVLLDKSTKPLTAQNLTQTLIVFAFSAICLQCQNTWYTPTVLRCHRIHLK